MKIGTDAVLLGAWTDIIDCASILDIGTGSGILALMLAQKSTALIDALEIDVPAAETAENNFHNSPWKSRLHIYKMSLNEFLKAKPKTYDLIVCNPPFFNNSLLSGDAKKNMAKHNVSLTYKELALSAFELLNPNGKISVILPFDNLKQFSDICQLHNFKCSMMSEVVPITNKKANRVLLQFINSQDNINCSRSSLTIRQDKNTFTSDYLQLTRAFLLNS